MHLEPVPPCARHQPGQISLGGHEQNAVTFGQREESNNQNRKINNDKRFLIPDICKRRPEPS